MRKLYILGLFGFGMTVLFHGNFSGEERPPGFDLPSQIQEFYEDINYICSNTSREERMKLAVYPEKGDEAYPESFPPEVVKRIKRIKRRIRFPEKDMHDPFFSKSLSLAVFLRPDLYEIQLASVQGSEAVVTLWVYGTAEVSPFKLRRKGRSNGSAFHVHQSPIRRKEAHRWIYRNGSWCKSVINVYFLKNRP